MLRRSFALRVGAGHGPFDPYKILGVEPTASKQDIKKAYRHLALRFHPDGGPEGNAERFSAVNEAYEAVKDGKWKHTAEQQRSSMKEGQGWDPKMRMYVYEQPGSTTEGYVTGHTQTIMRLGLLWCFLFITLRVLLLQIFPIPASQEDGVNAEHKGVPHLHIPGNYSPAVKGFDGTHHSDTDVRGADLVDPLQHRYS